MTFSIRHRFLAVALLGVTMCLVSLGALYRIMSVSSTQRLERARDAAVQETLILAGAEPDARLRGVEIAGPNGMKSGFVGDDDRPPGLEADWARPFDLARVAARASGKRAVQEKSVAGGMLVLAVTPARGGGFAWTAVPAPDPPNLRMWRIIVAALTAATLLLVAASVAAVTSVRASAGSLKSSLARLAHDLDAPVERPPVREMAEVADGIADLASALARSEKERDRLGAELADRERLAALGRVVAGVAHEVRNPLASIKLRLDLAVADPALPASYQQSLARTSEEIDRLDRLVRDLLLVAGQRRGVVERSSLGDLARARVDLLVPWALERDVRVSARGDATAEVASDAVARAIDNLVKNAVEASPAGAEVRVVVENDAGLAMVRVEDEGPGVAPERTRELFEPFFTTKSEGTGLGLAISRSIAASHGGTLTYARAGDRTRFSLSLGKAAA
ncbi:MAG TPA: ATP-binding protein [Byssovorax sp.]|jgi:signal transduction histidine kinase